MTSQIAAKYETVTSKTDIVLETIKDDNLLDYCFKGMFRSLDIDQQRVLVALSIFENDASAPEIVTVSGMAKDLANSSLDKLIRLTLIREKIDEVTEEPRYNLLPITRKFALKELNNDPNLKKISKDLRENLSRYTSKRGNFAKSLINQYSDYYDLTDVQKKALAFCEDALSMRSAGQYEEARKSYQRAERIIDEFPPIFYEWALFEWETGYKSDANWLFEKSRSLNMPKKLRRKISMSWVELLKSMKEFRKAADILKNLIMEYPGDLKIKHQHAVMLSRAGYYGQAEKIYVELLTDDKMSEEQELYIHRSRMQNLYKQGNRSEAREIYASLESRFKRFETFKSLKALLFN
ncbi:hypothetical protein [Deinococcus sp. SL84]|uniref:hypothetical protein n=1 Tax=Deinococcus sp. SL84 TaxID=2994663 RepID=UPI002272DC23|nr:hypothetical protein [Deinococcus sp. SL84]MCY1701490.1 hypothetical protein [Deinococcus sp. SL84]